MSLRISSIPGQPEFTSLADELVERFGRERLEETAFPTYTNWFPPAAWLAWRRVAWAQRMIGGGGGAALDFGSGLGVMLPFLAERFDYVVAAELDSDVTRFGIERLGLRAELVRTAAERSDSRLFDVVVALDVLEHVDDLPAVLTELRQVTAPNGRWIISGPTENLLYKLARIVARTKGDEVHVRTIHDIFDAIPSDMQRLDQRRLPGGLPLFLVGGFRN